MATPTVGFEIEGLKELAKNADKLRRSFTTSTLRTALRGAAKPVLRRAKATVPVDSGRLKRSLGTRAKVERGGFGFADVEARRGGKYQGYHAHLVELGTSQQSAQPFLRPAIDAAGRAGEVDAAFVEAINKTIERQLARIAAK